MNDVFQKYFKLLFGNSINKGLFLSVRVGQQKSFEELKTPNLRYIRINRKD